MAVPRTENLSIAVAGVTTGLGFAIASALLASPSLSVTLLTRSSQGLQPILLPLQEKGAIVKLVDYSSLSSLVTALRGVNTVISTIWHYDDITPVKNLLKAAQEAGVKRFAPSEFALSAPANNVISAYHTKNIFWKDLERSGLEYTAFRTGIFMDYFAFGSNVSHPNALRLFPYVINVAQRKAEIPGTGNEPITFTSLQDVGKFVAAAVLLDSWPAEMGMSGETTTYNQILKEAEGIINEKFTVTYLNKEELQERAENTAPENWVQKLLIQAQISCVEGLGEIHPYLNQVTDVTPTKVGEFLNVYWSKDAAL